MDSIPGSVAAAELIFPVPLSSPPESKFWSRSAVPYNMKSEGPYINNLSTKAMVNNNNNTSSISSGSCLASLMQVIDQSGKYNPPPFNSCASDSMALVEIDQAKCGFSTVTSTQRGNQYSKAALDNILEDSALGLNASSSELDSMWRLPYSGWDPRREELKGEAPAQGKPVAGGLCRFPSEISDDSSLDGGLPPSSTVSSTSEGLATEADHEDDVYVDGSSTSVEIPSMSNFTLSSPRMLPGSSLALPSTCSEGSTLSTDQVRSCGLDSPLVELESRLVDQTLPLVADVEQNSSAAKTLQLGNDGNIVLVQPPQEGTQQNERQQTSSSMELKWNHEAPALDASENWSTKRLKPSPPSSPTTPPALSVPFLAPNLPCSLNGMNVNPPTPAPFLMTNNTASPNVYQMPTIPTLGSAPDMAKVPPPGPPGTKPPFMAPHQFLFGANFPSVVNIDIREIENSRPKRRNVKISKDPQSVAARHRRERISDRIRVLQRLVPGGTKMDTASMLDEAISYVKYLKLQVQTLESCGNAGFDPRMQFPAYYLPVRPAQGDCSTQIAAPGVAPDHGIYGSALGQSAMKFPDAYREQFCH